MSSNLEPGDFSRDTPTEDLVQKIRRGVLTHADTTWAFWPNVVCAYQFLAEEFINSKLATPEGVGRGIVTAGGGLKYFPSVWVLVNVLRELGCKLPIEVWHLDDLEMDPKMEALLTPLGVQVRNAQAETNAKHMRNLRGWELKPFAVKHSAFAEVLFIDADCAPIIDPAFLFDCEPYRRTGSVFWPDYASWTLPAEAWTAFGLPAPTIPPRPFWTIEDTFGRPIPDDTDPPLESGQFLVNKSRCWRELSLASWYCDHSEFTFRHVYGDKETFRMAWRKLGTQYALPRFWPGWTVHSIVHRDFDGRMLFFHRTQDKWKYEGGNVPAHHPYEKFMFAAMDALRQKWNGRVWVNSTPSENDRRIANRAFAYRRVGHDVRTLEFEPDGAIGVGADRCERSWSLFETPSRQVLAIHGDAGLTCLLTPSSSSDWKGAWVAHEKMPVELTLLPPRKQETLNIGCGLRPLPGATNHDATRHASHVDVAWDLNAVPWPVQVDSLDCLVAHDVVEHLNDTVLFMNEAWRVLRRGGKLRLSVPHFAHWTAWADPTHRQRYAPQSFQFFTDEGMGKTSSWVTALKWKQLAHWQVDGTLHFVLEPIKPDGKPTGSAT